MKADNLGCHYRVLLHGPWIYEMNCKALLRDVLKDDCYDWLIE